MTKLSKLTLLIFILFKISLLELSSDHWGEQIRRVDSVWSRAAPRLGKQSKRQSEKVSLRFVDSQNQRRLPFWYRKAGKSNSEWKWVGAGSSIDQEDLEHILEFDLGYDYLKPLPLQTGILGVKEKVFEAEFWYGEAWSPYLSARYQINSNLRLPNDLRWLEAWQVSAGIKMVVWPYELLNSYPRSSLISAKEGTWRSLCQQVTSLGNVHIRSISEKLDYLKPTRESLPFSWDAFIESVQKIDWNLVNAYGGFSRREKWQDKWIFPLMPILFAGSYFDILELSSKHDLDNYRFLLEQGHRISQVYLNNTPDPLAPDICVLRQEEGLSELINLKEGRFSSSMGFAFDWILESETKVRYRIGEAFPISESPLRPMFRFSKHPNYSPLVEVRLYKGSELMVSSRVPENISKGTLDLGRYFFDHHDSMSLEIEHKDGRLSVLNPIYAGGQKFFVSKVRDVPVRINNLQGASMEIVYLKSGLHKSIPLDQKNIDLDVPWYETLCIESNGVKKEIEVWRLWLNQAVKELPEKSSFREQYLSFERSFPLIVTWPL